MALLLAPEIFAGIAGIAADISGSATVGTLVSGTAAGAVDAGIKTGVENVVDSIFGAGTSSNVENTLGAVKKDPFGIGSGQLQDPFANNSELNSLGTGGLAARAAQSSNSIYGKYSKMASGANIPASPDTLIDEPCKCDSDPVIGDMPIQGQNKDATKSTQLQNSIGTVDISTPIDTRTIGKNLGSLISLSNSNLNNQLSSGISRDPFKAMTDAVTMYPSLTYLVPKLLSYQSPTTPDTSQYAAISSVYNGKTLSVHSVVQTINPQGLKVFTAFDEVGKKYEWVEKKDGLKIPTINGVWTGPYSVNNALPTNLLDTFSMYHDCDYRDNGFFDLEGDYKLISRCSQNLARMGLQERALAKGTINYFSTIGHTLANYKGTLPDNVGTTIVTSSTKDDILPVIVPEIVNDPIYPQKQYEFYNGLISGMQEEDTRSSTYPQMMNSNNVIYQYLSNLQVEVD